MARAGWRVSAVILLGCAASVSSFSCSDSSSSLPETPSETPVGTVSLAVDGCTDAQRNACGSFGCGCVDGNCSGGACPPHVLVDGCTTTRKDQCAAFGCGCLNGECSGGACAPLFDGCTNDKR